jgi:pSer/pThr/pTyr-binding forkhead associated (FHA) protein
MCLFRDVAVSREHARVEYREGEYYVIHMSKRNFTEAWLPVSVLLRTSLYCPAV